MNQDTTSIMVGCAIGVVFISVILYFLQQWGIIHIQQLDGSGTLKGTKIADGSGTLKGTKIADGSGTLKETNADGSGTLKETKNADSSETIIRTNAENMTGDPSEIRIVLLGKTGAGKSTTGNAILGFTSPEKEGDPGFVESDQSVSETKVCRRQARKLNGRTVQVIDTPGVFDNTCTPAENKFEISRSLLFSSPGPHIVLFVMSKFSRFTEEDCKAYKQMRDIFNPSLVNYLCLAFTHCNPSKDDKITMETKFKKDKEVCEKAKAAGQKPIDINKVLDEVDHRFVLFYTNDKKATDRQVLELLRIVDQMEAVNPSPFFQDDRVKQASEWMNMRLHAIMKLRNKHDKNEALKYLLIEIDGASYSKSSKEVKHCKDILKLNGDMNAQQALETISGNNSFCSIL